VPPDEIRVEHLLRSEAPQVLGALVRRFGHFEVAEDAVQETLLAAVQRWPTEGVPEHPRSWLIRVGYRRMVDLLRSDQARRNREMTSAVSEEPMQTAEPAEEADDSLTLLFLCCHPALSPVSQVALTLRAVGGLTTAEIAHAYGLAESAMAQRISRAKQQIRHAGPGRTNSRRRSRLSTTRRPATPTPTGPRSRRCTPGWSGSRPHRWCVSAAPSRSAWLTVRCEGWHCWTNFPTTR
jgi:RNA polymerase sigma factor (sigma-70 family)